MCPFLFHQGSGPGSVGGEKDVEPTPLDELRIEQARRAVGGRDLAGKSALRLASAFWKFDATAICSGSPAPADVHAIAMTASVRPDQRPSGDSASARWPTQKDGQRKRPVTLSEIGLPLVLRAFQGTLEAHQAANQRVVPGVGIFDP